MYSGLPFPLLPIGDSADEASVSVSFSYEGCPPSAHLQSPSYLVVGGRETALQPPGPGAGQSLCRRAVLIECTLQFHSLYICLQLLGVLKRQRTVQRPAFARPDGAFIAFSSPCAASLGSEASWQPVLSDTLITWQSSLPSTGRGWATKSTSCAQKSNLVVILYLSFAVFIHKNIHKWKIIYGKINKWWIQTSANIWWLMSQMSHFPSCFYQTFALGQLPFLNFLLLCLHITDPNLPAVCQLQSMFISRNYMTSDLQPQEMHGCAHLNVGGASPEVHVIKLHSSGSGLCGWEQATTWCPGKSRN